MSNQLALCLGAMLALLPATALAEHHHWDSHHWSWASGDSTSTDSCVGCDVAAGLLIGAPDAAFAIVDLVLLSSGKWLPPGWATLQIVGGLAHSLVGLILTPLGIIGLLLQGTGAGCVLGVGILLLIVGTVFVIHGIWSLVKHFTHKESAEPPRATSALLPTVTYAASPQGATALLTWRF